MGEDALYSALRRYVAENKFQNVFHLDLLNILSQQPISDGSTNSPVDFNTHLLSWIEENGYPVITLRRSGEGAKDISYEQKRFLSRTGNSSTETAVNKTRIWHIPLSLAFGDVSTSIDNPIGGRGDNDRRYKSCWITKASGWNSIIWIIVKCLKHLENYSFHAGQLMDQCLEIDLNYPARPPSDTFELNFIIANPGQYGMYRVNYDRENWRRISLQLNRERNGHRVSLLITSECRTISYFVQRHIFFFAVYRRSKPSSTN